MTDPAEGTTSDKKLTIVDRGRVVRGLDEVWDALVELAAELAPEDWERPTECPGWSVKDHYAHIIGTEAMLLGRPSPDIAVPDDLQHVRNDIGRVNEAWVLSYRDRTGADMVSDLAEVVTERRAALAVMDQAAFDEPSWTPVGQDTYGRFMCVRVMDQWFHEQDVREVTGRPGHLEGVAPELVLDEVGRMLGYVVGKQAGIPEGISVRWDLRGPMSRVFDIEVTDRARVVDELEGPPTVTLVMSGDRFLRVVGGRRPWDDPGIRSAVTVEGDEALAEQLLSNLKYMI